MKALSEREAERLADGLTAAGTGLSHTESWARLIEETVEQSHVL